MYTPNPIAFYIPFIDWPVYWYGLVYAFSVILTALWLPALLRIRGVSEAKRDQVWDVVFAIFLGVIIGGRLGYFLFYHPGLIFTDPLQIFQIWQGGMSFHGGLIGGVTGAIFAVRQHCLPVWKLADAIVLPLSLALALGRWANFVNGELVGRVTDLSIGIKFPDWAGRRHPSQLYEMGKNLLLAVVFIPLIFRACKLPDGMIFILWLQGYAVLRFVIEFWREPDWVWLGLSGGQWLCLGMLVTGSLMMNFLRMRGRED